MARLFSSGHIEGYDKFRANHPFLNGIKLKPYEIR
jgi:hypothetical protein